MIYVFYYFPFLFHFFKTQKLQNCFPKMILSIKNLAMRFVLRCDDSELLFPRRPVPFCSTMIGSFFSESSRVSCFSTFDCDSPEISSKSQVHYPLFRSCCYHSPNSWIRLSFATFDRCLCRMQTKNWTSCPNCLENCALSRSMVHRSCFCLASSIACGPWSVQPLSLLWK